MLPHRHRSSPPAAPSAYPSTVSDTGRDRRRAPGRTMSRQAVAMTAAAVLAGMTAPAATATTEDRDWITAHRATVDADVYDPSRPLRVLARDPLVPLVVLGARLDEDCTPPQVLQDRLDAAAELAVARPDATVVVTGGTTRTGCVSEASAMAAVLRSSGVINTVVTEEAATSTLGNVENTRQLILDRGGLAVVVTSDPHYVRALDNYRDAGVEAVAYVRGQG